MLGASAFAAPAGSPLCPGLRRSNARRRRARWCSAANVSVSVSGDDLGDAVNRLRQRIALQTGWTLQPQAENQTNRPSASSPKR
jgi:hexosaminidase